eukprot:IDg3039t1
MVGRGASYSPEEDTALARCWAAASLEHDEQNATAFWGSVAASFCRQPEAEEARTGSSLRCHWGTLAKAVQKYLAAERLYLAKPVSGESQDEILANIMRLFRSRTRVRDKNGAFKDGPPLRSMGAVEVLRHLPKFGCGSPTAVGNDGTGTTASISDGDDLEHGDQVLEPTAECVRSHRGEGVLPPIQVSKYRPAGVKKAK